MIKPIPQRLSYTLLVIYAILVGIQSVYAADPKEHEIYTRTENLDWAMLKRHANFGYTVDELKKYFDYHQIFEYDATGLAPGRIKPPPAPGAHPRVLFSSKDLPELRLKLIESKPGKLQMDGIRAMLHRDLTGPNATYGELYGAAARGEGRPELMAIPPACSIIYECFRCLVDNDVEGGKKVAAALTTLAILDGAELDRGFAKADKRFVSLKAESLAKTAIRPPLRDYQEFNGLVQGGLLGLGYDFAYNRMTDAQRDIVRQAIAKASGNMTILCAEGLPAFPANVSNWIPMHMRLVFLCCAIEGEKGYDASTYLRCVEGYKRYLSISGFPAGDMYESMGKNFLCAENLIPVANRGNNLLALKMVRAQVGSYYLHAMDPWGGHFTFYDSLGGRGNTTPMQDVLVLKHLFPRDPAIDFVYRNTVGENYETFKAPVRFGHPFFIAAPLIQAIFAEPYAAKTWDQAHADATAGKPLTFFSNDSGNLITRSSWDKNALQLHFLARSTSGGHQYADRTHFSVHALGRYWAIYKPLRQVEEHYQPKNRSVTLIDGRGPGMTMGRVAALADTLQATFIAADAKSAYEWQSGGNDRFPKGGQRVAASANDFRLHRSSLPWMDLPWSDLPYWQTSIKGAEMWIPHNQVQRAFRTAGVVRGPHPYVLVVDDFQKDASPHEYQWGMILEDDLIQVSAVRDAAGQFFRDDVVLGEKKSGDLARYMLVRVLNAEGREKGAVATIDTFSLPNPPQKPIPMHRLVVVSKAVAPDFKAILFPYLEGQSPPKTAWNADRTNLRIEWLDQRDIATFTKGTDGRTRIRVTRDNQQLMVID